MSSAGGGRAAEERSGAWHGWVVAGVVFLSSALTIGASNYAFGLYIRPLELAFGWSRTALSTSLAFAAIGGLTAPLIGRLMDARGGRAVLAGSLTLFGVSMALRPFMGELWHLYALSILQFVAFTGMNTLPAGKLVGLWFPRKTGRAMGFTMMGNNFGGMTVPLLTGYLLAAWTWREAFAVTGALAFAIAVAAALIIRNPPLPAATKTRGAPASSKPRTLIGLTLGQALRTRAFYLVTTAIALGSFTYSALLPHISAHLLDQGTPDATVITLLSTLGAFGMAGKGVFGYLAERHTARAAMMLSLAGQTALISVIVFQPVGAHLWVIVPVYGFFFGAFGVLITLLMQECFGIAHFGAIAGMSSLAGGVPSTALGPLLAGASRDHLGSYGPAFMAVAALFVAAIALLVSVKSPLQRMSELTQDTDPTTGGQSS